MLGGGLHALRRFGGAIDPPGQSLAREALSNPLGTLRIGDFERALLRRQNNAGPERGLARTMMPDCE